MSNSANEKVGCASLAYRLMPHFHLWVNGNRSENSSPKSKHQPIEESIEDMKKRLEERREQLEFEHHKQLLDEAARYTDFMRVDSQKRAESEALSQLVNPPGHGDSLIVAGGKPPGALKGGFESPPKGTQERLSISETDYPKFKGSTNNPNGVELPTVTNVVIENETNSGISSHDIQQPHASGSKLQDKLICKELRISLLEETNPQNDNSPSKQHKTGTINSAYILTPDKDSDVIHEFNSHTAVAETSLTSLPREARRLPRRPHVGLAASWTRPGVRDFKELVAIEPESEIHVVRGETVTVRVPTHSDGNCLFWEFATDNYDIGFGLYFEWADGYGPTGSSGELSTETSSSEEDSYSDSECDYRPNRRSSSRRNASVIIPCYRTDSHLAVHVGSHFYPGNGYYLLKFDNSYSVFRGKRLYYRVYYTK